MADKTITVPGEVYERLESVSHGNIVQFLAMLVERPSTDELDAQYAAIAADQQLHEEAHDWSEGTLSDVGNEPW